MNKRTILCADLDSIEVAANASIEDLMNVMLTGSIHNLDFRAAILNVAVMIISGMQTDARERFTTMLEDTVTDKGMLENIRDAFKVGESLSKTYLTAEESKDMRAPSYPISPSKVKS